MNTVSGRELGISEFTFGGWLFSLLAKGFLNYIFFNIVFICSNLQIGNK